MKTGDISVIATEKQQRAISFIENTLETTFTGTTKGKSLNTFVNIFQKQDFAKA